MDQLVMHVGPDELLGLQALAKLNGNGTTGGPSDQLEHTAGLMMRQGLETMLREAGLPWAPTSEVVEEHRKAPRPVTAVTPSPVQTGAAPAPVVNRVPAPAQPGTGGAHPLVHLMSILDDKRVKRVLFPALGIATLVVLLGGYVGRWSWTGFETNNQLWNWLHLVLLPVAFGTVPLWLRFAEHMSHTRKVILAGVALAFVGFVIAGYLVPLSWTGFSGNTLWNWLTLIVLPVALISVRAWPSSRREIRNTHIAVFSVLGAAWIVTLIGGYASTWKWTGYQGNTLWDWLSLLLAPLVITTVLVPGAVKWVSGDVARRAQEAARESAAAARLAAAAQHPNG
jgi:hypothetical protein